MSKRLKTIKNNKNPKILIISVVLLAFFCVNAFKSSNFSRVLAAGENSFVNVQATALTDLEINGYYNTNEIFDINILSGTATTTTVSLSFSNITVKNIINGGEDLLFADYNTEIIIHSDIYSRFLLTDITSANVADPDIKDGERYIALKNDNNYNLFYILLAADFPTYESNNYGNVIRFEYNNLKIYYNDDYAENDISTPANIGIGDNIVMPANVKQINNKAILFNVYDSSDTSFLLNDSDLPYYFKIISNNFAEKNGGFTVDDNSIFGNGTNYYTMYLYSNKLCWSETEVPLNDGISSATLNGAELVGNYNAIKFILSADIKLVYYDFDEYKYYQVENFEQINGNVFFDNFSLCINVNEVTIQKETQKPIGEYDQERAKTWAADNALALLGFGLALGPIGWIFDVVAVWGAGDGRPLWGGEKGTVAQQIGNFISELGTAATSDLREFLQETIQSIPVLVDGIIDGLTGSTLPEKILFGVLIIASLVTGGFVFYLIKKDK